MQGEHRGLGREQAGNTPSLSETERGDGTARPPTRTRCLPRVPQRPRGHGARVPPSGETDAARGRGLAVWNSSGPRSKMSHSWSCLCGTLGKRGASPSHFLSHSFIEIRLTCHITHPL